MIVTSYETCASCKQEKRPQYGLSTIEVPTQPWKTISLDFIVDLPPSHGYNTVLIVVDLLTKMSHFVPLKNLPSAQETAGALLREVFKLHEIPSQIISDRATQFI